MTNVIKYILFFCFFIFSSALYASDDVIHGPFYLDSNRDFNIEFIKRGDESIDFIKKTNLDIQVIDSYQVGDGLPKIDTIFFTTVRKIKNIIVLVSWDEGNINATHYKIYVYKYKINGNIVINHDVMRDKNLEGYDGYSSSGMIFNYKNADSIKEYISKIK